MTTLAAPQERERWNLVDLYADAQAYGAAFSTFSGRIDAIAAYRGRLGESPQLLAEAMALRASLLREYRALASYAQMSLDLDRRNAASLARSQESDLAATRLDTACAFLGPELLSLPDGWVTRAIAAEPGLSAHAHELTDILSRRPHTLREGEEALLAGAGVLATGPYSVYGMLMNADLPWPEVTLSGGETARLDPSGFAKHRASADRTDRERVFQTYFDALSGFSRTLGVILDAEVKKTIYYARARRYGSSLEAALDRHRIPVGVYDAMLGAAREGRPTLHRYLKLRRRILGVPTLAYHDIYAPLAAASSRRYSVEEAEAIVLDAVRPLGSAYVESLASGFASRWIDYHPATGKRSGAYSNGSVYGNHPFILMNFTGNFDGVSTLAHECGHAMHSYLANQSQPFPTADYAIFVAEVASTLNEALVYDRCTRLAADDEERLGLLVARLDGMRGTFFRQGQFAQFERRFHRAAEEGTSLTADRLGAWYLEEVRASHGHDEGVCIIDERYRVEWSAIPHFYANFYVFQYATGIAAATFLASRILAGDPEAARQYLGFLSAGGSDYPYALLARYGVDLARPDPYRAAIAAMDHVMDAIEAILDKRGVRT